MKRKALLGLLMSVNLLVASFSGYSLWSRSGAPSFSVGGAFGAGSAPGSVIAPQSSASPSEPARASMNGARAIATPTARATTKISGARTNRTVAVALPRAGTYVFDGTGKERIEFGGGSPCSWDIDRVQADFKMDGRSVVKDIVYSQQRQERVIFEYDADGVYTSFVGAAVTCLGVRKTTEDRYEPPAMRIKLPFVRGTTWSERARTQDRTEEIRGEIVRPVRLTVAAGTFDTWEVQVRTEISGSQEGAYESTFWFAPQLGTSVKQIEHTDVRASGAHFTSDVTLSLASLP